MNTYGNQSQNAGRDAPTPITSVDGALARVNTMIEIASTNAVRARAVLARAFGEGPTPGEKGVAKLQPVSCGACSELHERLEVLSNLLAEGSAALDRIESIV